MRRIKTKKEKKKDLRVKLLYVLFVLVSIGTIAFLTTSLYSLGNQKLLSPIAQNTNTKEGIIKKVLSDKNFKIKQINFKKTYYQVILSDNSELYFSSEKDLYKQLSSLQLILTRLTIEGKTFKRLDFRYDKAVVSF